MNRHCCRPVAQLRWNFVPKALYAVKKYSWWWANLSPEICRADLKRLINEKVVASRWLLTSLYLWCTVTQTSSTRRICRGFVVWRRQWGASWILLSTKYYYGAQTKEAEMGGTEMKNPFCSFTEHAEAARPKILWSATRKHPTNCLTFRHSASSI